MTPERNEKRTHNRNRIYSQTLWPCATTGLIITQFINSIIILTLANALVWALTCTNIFYTFHSH